MARPDTLPAPDLVVRGAAATGEGPVLDPRTGRLCWVDIPRGELRQTDLGSAVTTVTTVPMSLGAAVPRASTAGFAVAAADGFGFVEGETFRLVDPVLPEPERRMNDAKCDSRGRLWAGSTRGFEPGRGMLHRWDGTGPSRVMSEGHALPNGLGWSPDDRQMYFIDTFAHRVHVADFDADAETIDLRPLFDVTDGLPDGMAVDLDGLLWIAIWGGAEVRRYTPAGEVVARIPMPVAQPSSCAFGPDGTLYITSARGDLDAAALATQPLAGSVFAVATTTRGVPVASFAG